jgi:hypothetical protein
VITITGTPDHHPGMSDHDERNAQPIEQESRIAAQMEENRRE